MSLRRRSTSIGEIGSTIHAQSITNVPLNRPTVRKQNTKQFNNNNHVVESKVTQRAQGSKEVHASMKFTSKPVSLSKTYVKPTFFIGSPERENEKDGVPEFGELINKCNFCKKEFNPEKDIFMYMNISLCSEDCRDGRLALDGYSRSYFGLDKKNSKVKRSLRKDLKQLWHHNS